MHLKWEVFPYIDYSSKLFAMEPHCVMVRQGTKSSPFPESLSSAVGESFMATVAIYCTGGLVKTE